MEGLKAYLLTMISGAMLIGIINRFVDKSRSSGAILQIAGSMFLLLTLVRPLVQLDFSKLGEIPENMLINSAQIAEGGVSMAESLQSQSISQQLNAYVLKKAAELGLELSVDIQLGAAPAFLPESATICGNASPYAKSLLQRILADDLGIPKEKQTWIS